MNVFLQLAAFLDKKAFLSSRLWQFCLQNVFRAFPWYFFFCGLLWHPRRACGGVKRYQQLVGFSHGALLSGTAELQNLEKLAGENRFLVAPGFCMKPYDYEHGRSMCPVGHFNHKCLLLDNAKIWQQNEKWPAPCRKCGVAPLVKVAVRIQADIYIMTSAIDIAKDVYIPALRNRGAQRGLFFLCPYSLEPFTFGLAAAGISGILIPFCRGECRNFAEWTRADIGQKNDQTYVASELWQKIFQQLEKIRPIHCSEKQAAYEFANHVYRPADAAS